MKKKEPLTRTKIKASAFLIIISTLSFLSMNLILLSTEEELLNKYASSKDSNDNLKISGSYSDIQIDDSLTGVGAHNWTWAATQPWCTGSGTSIDPYIIDGHIFNYSSLYGPCFSVYNSRKYFIMRNCIIRESNPSYIGLVLSNTTNGVISNNQFYNNGAGVRLYNCSKNTVSGNTVYDNLVYGIMIGLYSYHNIISGNTIHNNSQYGIYIDTSNFNDISGNSVYNHSSRAIYLDSSNHNNLTSNNIYDSKAYGIYFYVSDENTIDQNNINNNKLDGIFLSDSTYNILKGNSISANTENGIHLDGSYSNVLSDNIIFDNILYGISLDGSYSDNTNITKNEIYHNNESGIYIDVWTWNAFVGDNDIYDNIVHGIHLGYTEFGEYYGNLIHDNNEFGIYCSSAANDNLFHENVFVRNKKHAVDDASGGNDWNSTTIGNYWDNHTGPDTSPQDGIVDVQYNIIGLANSIDYLPIAEDGPPTINIVSPSTDDLFNESAPDFTITATDDFLYSMWYTTNGGPTEYPFTGFSGTIDQSAWDALSDGNVTLSFYARDLPGNTGTDEVVIEKDSLAPVITINSPAVGDEFGNTPPSFNITVTDPNLDTIWYTVDGNFTIVNSTLVWTVSQEIWDAFPEGTVTITIHANDTLGHSSSQSVSITKNIPSRGIGLDYFMTGFLITLFCGVTIIAITLKIYRKKQIIKY